MTKYILHGGNASDANRDNDAFFAEMTRGLAGKVKIILNYFSRADEEVSDCAEQDKKSFLGNSENKDLEFEIADASMMAQQLQRANVMYIRGGETARLLEKMNKTSEIERLFESKVIGGSSAGVYVLSKYYWENDADHIGEGLSIFNVKAFCHYTPEDKKIIERLLKYKENLPILTLPNYKWIVCFK